ncbi:hypothetical protein JCM3774_000799 [Rhodotorula dairenensis]
MVVRLSPALASSASTHSIERVPSPTPSQRNKDVEKGDDDAAIKGGEVTFGPPLTPGTAGDGEGLQRQMSSRHIAMISLGGAIGTGLYLGIANALATGGPLGLLLGYSLMGTIVYATMTALGEMSAHLPVPGGVVTLAARFVDKSFAMVIGWGYMYAWLLALPAELTASAVLIGYWDKTTNPAVYITVTGVVAIAINWAGARAYGEAEFWFASLKIITIIGLIILGVILTAGGGPSGEVIGGKYWRDPGPFVQYLGIDGSLGQFLGFWTVLTQAAYSYIGSEVVALAAAESRNPKKTVPSAIRKVWIRIVVFYVLSVLIVGLLVPSNDPRLRLSTGTAASSPFVIAISDAGIHALPSVVNAAILTSAWSAASSDLYTSSRTLYGLALQGNAPRWFAKTTSWGLPARACLLGIAFACLAYLSAGAGTAGKVFGWLANMCASCGLVVWFGIGITYLRFFYGLKAQGIDRKELPFRAPLQPYLTIYALTMIFLILFFANYTVFIDGQWDTASFITSYLPFMLLPTGYLAAHVWKRFIRRLPPSEWARTPLLELDFVSGSRDGDPDVEEEKPRTLLAKISAFFF